MYILLFFLLLLLNSNALYLTIQKNIKLFYNYHNNIVIIPSNNNEVWDDGELSWSDILNNSTINNSTKTITNK